MNDFFRRFVRLSFLKRFPGSFFVSMLCWRGSWGSGLRVVAWGGGFRSDDQNFFCSAVLS